MKLPSILTIGSCVRDIFCYTRGGFVIKTKQLLTEEVLGFEVGGKTAAQTLVHTCGGSAANAGVTFSRLGFRTAVMTALGKDVYGDECLQALRAEGISLSYVQRLNVHTTGSSVIVNQIGTHKHFIIVHRGASEHLTVTASRLRGANPGAIYLSALHGTHSDANLKTITTYVKKHHLPLFWNPGGKQLATAGVIRTYAPSAYVLMLNADESRELLLNKKLHTAPKPAELCRRLHAWGSAIVVVTDGHRGAYAYDGTTTYYERAIIGKTANKTGAGDSFGSAFSAGLLMFQGNIRRSLKLATLNAHRVVQTVGAQQGILYKREIARHRI